MNKESCLLNTHLAGSYADIFKLTLLQNRVSAKSRKSGKSRRNACRLKNVREKPGNSTNSRDNQGNSWEIVCLCFFDKSISRLFGNAVLRIELFC